MPVCMCMCFRKEGIQQSSWRLQPKIVADCLRTGIKAFIFKTQNRGKKH